jgi:hypothetical protein
MNTPDLIELRCPTCRKIYVCDIDTDPGREFYCEGRAGVPHAYLRLTGADRITRQKYQPACTFCDTEKAAGNSFFPSHYPSSRCQSGSYNHCTCDTCF